MFHTFHYRDGFIHLRYDTGCAPEYRAQHGTMTRPFASVQAAKRWLSLQSGQPQTRKSPQELARVHH